MTVVTTTTTTAKRQRLYRVYIVFSIIMLTLTQKLSVLLLFFIIIKNNRCVLCVCVYNVVWVAIAATFFPLFFFDCFNIYLYQWKSRHRFFFLFKKCFTYFFFCLIFFFIVVVFFWFHCLFLLTIPAILTPAYVYTNNTAFVTFFSLLLRFFLSFTGLEF